MNPVTFTGDSVSGIHGYAMADPSRITVETLETVSYYDDYGFISLLGGALEASSVYSSARGSKTGGVSYDTSGAMSKCAVYYDLRGNILQTREITGSGRPRDMRNTYGFSNQPLTGFFSENGQSLRTTYGYHTPSGLPLTTDVTVNGSGHRISELTYDDLGRVVSEKRGGKGGTVSRTYNLHGQVASISGPGFSQTLHYAEGPGKPLYNGSVSSMTWDMGTRDPRPRGYRYFYNDYGWLTLASYGEGSTLSVNRDRYTEKISEFMRNGGPRRLQRHGLKADGNYGKIDNLHIYYDGNRVTGVLEDAEAVTQTGSMDFAGRKAHESAFSYDASGSLVSDESRGIVSVRYDNHGNPSFIRFADGGTITNVYSPEGLRLKTVSRTGVVSAVSGGMESDAVETLSSDEVVNALSGTSTEEYRGPFRYVNGVAVQAFFPGGYATLQSGVTFHYYTCDYLGNNRAVVNGMNGELEQTVSYYPYGGVIADLGTGHGVQPFKFGGKELMTTNGLNEYDFGARQYWHAVPGFNRIDPLCEKYYWLSPYLYCGNDPVNAIDPDGREWIISSSKDSDGILHINMKITGAILDKTNLTNKQKNKLASEIKSQIENVYTFSGDNFKVNMTADIRVVNNESELNNKDHIFRIVYNGEIDNETHIAKGVPYGLKIRIRRDLVSKITTGHNTRTVSHEVGHTGGLEDNDSNIKDKKSNLMTQINSLPDKNSKNQAVEIEIWQLNAIINNYNLGKLNK